VRLKEYMEVICGREDKDRGWERAKGYAEHGGGRLLRNVGTSVPNYGPTHATK